MIEFFLGKTGAGKSYLAIKEIRNFLVSSDDGYVVTNLAIDLGALNAYLARRYPKRSIDVINRVRILSDSEARYFYLHRERGVDLHMTTKEEQDRLEFPPFSEAANNSQFVLYVIDEAHIFFDSRAWGQVGLTLNFFASQHRKFRCDIIFVTQFLDQCEKRLRLHATRYIECSNWGMRQWMFWRLPKRFRTAETYKQPPCPAETSGSCQMEIDLANCYDTSAGVGVRGGRAPERVRRKGLPFWTLPATVLAIVGVLYLFADTVVPNALNSIGGSVKDMTAEVSTAVTAVVPSVVNDSTAPGVNKEQPRYMSGYMVRGDRALVSFTDGSVIDSSDPSYNGLETRGLAVWVDGQRVLRKPFVAVPVERRPVESRLEPVPLPPMPYNGEAPVPTPDSVIRAANAAERPSVMGSRSRK